MGTTASITRSANVPSSPRLYAHFRRLWYRPDFRRNPIRAIWRRLYWRWRWLCTSEPWPLRLTENLVVLAPRTGSGALIYYQGQSEPETAQFVLRFLKPGMIFVDVGAHIGEYALLASRAVRSEGQVHAFEPVHELSSLLAQAVTRNRASNVVVNRSALANTNGTTDFVICKELACSSIAYDETSGNQNCLRTDSVPVQSLDHYCEQRAITPHLIKVDVEGAEMLVLDGAKRLLALPADRAPVWIIECSEENYARFGANVNTLRTRFMTAGWYLYALRSDGSLEPSKGNFRTPMNIVATARPSAP